MKYLSISTMALSLLTSAALAQQIVPAIDPNTGYANPHTQVSSNPVVPTQAKLSQKDRQAVGLAQEWINQQDVPMRGDNGTVVFPFGATLPTIVCSPNHLCDVSLQPGEKVNQLDVADPIRWKVTPSSSGAGETLTTHLVIKPTSAALTTSVVVNTDRRTYSIQLISRKDEWMPMVAFQYAEDTQAVWTAYAKRQYEVQEMAPHPAPQPANNFDFGYKITGSPKWKPILVYSDHEKTYIQFPKNAAYSEVPALVALSTQNKEQLVNYRMEDGRFIVDKVLDHAALISGVGRSQQKVEIVKDHR